MQHLQPCNPNGLSPYPYRHHERKIKRKIHEHDAGKEGRDEYDPSQSRRRRDAMGWLSKWRFILSATRDSSWPGRPRSSLAGRVMRSFGMWLLLRERHVAKAAASLGVTLHPP